MEGDSGFHLLLLSICLFQVLDLLLRRLLERDIQHANIPVRRQLQLSLDIYEVWTGFGKRYLDIYILR